MNFRPIKPNDYSKLKPYFIQQPYNLCVYSLSSLLVWNNSVYHPYGAEDGDSLIIYAHYDEPRKHEEHLILPISSVKEHSPEDLKRIVDITGVSSFWFVPETYIEQHGTDRIEAFFEIAEQPAFHDYVYLTQDLAMLKGNKYSRKRNLIHQFRKEYLNKGRVQVEPITTGAASECLDFLDKWCEETACDVNRDESLACERQAVINTFTHYDLLHMKGLLLRIDGDVSAFGIMSHLNRNMGVLHFEKAFTGIKGLYQYFDNLCAQRLFDGYTYINKESDMGIPGLAKAKESYYPTMIVKSYTLTIRESH